MVVIAVGVFIMEVITVMGFIMEVIAVGAFIKVFIMTVLVADSKSLFIKVHQT